LGEYQTGDIPIEKIEELETLFLSSDMGIKTTEEILEWLGNREGKVNLQEDLSKYLQFLLVSNILSYEEYTDTPAAIFIVGVNGTGKTTSAAKLAHLLKKEDFSVLLIGADTYRAAAIEQLRKWCKIADIDMVCNESAKDPSSVVFDGLKAAQARENHYAIIDTAGRLHTYKNLMVEVEKMYRVATTKFKTFRVITYLTIDANLGQNSITQAYTFNEHIPLDGIILTKMDGTAKGGIIFPIYRELKIPVKYVGIGETINDLIQFDHEEYVFSLLNLEKSESLH